jgi:hypothetical protein
MPRRTCKETVSLISLLLVFKLALRQGSPLKPLWAVCFVSCSGGENVFTSVLSTSKRKTRTQPSECKTIVVEQRTVITLLDELAARVCDVTAVLAR